MRIPMTPLVEVENLGYTPEQSEWLQKHEWIHDPFGQEEQRMETCREILRNGGINA